MVEDIEKIDSKKLGVLFLLVKKETFKGGSYMNKLNKLILGVALLSSTCCQAYSYWADETNTDTYTPGSALQQGTWNSNQDPNQPLDQTNLNQGQGSLNPGSWGQGASGQNRPNLERFREEFRSRNWSEGRYPTGWESPGQDQSQAQRQEMINQGRMRMNQLRTEGAPASNEEMQNPTPGSSGTYSRDFDQFRVMSKYRSANTPGSAPRSFQQWRESFQSPRPFDQSSDGSQYNNQ